MHVHCSGTFSVQFSTHLSLRTARFLRAYWALLLNSALDALLFLLLSSSHSEPKKSLMYGFTYLVMVLE